MNNCGMCTNDVNLCIDCLEGEQKEIKRLQKEIKQLKEALRKCNEDRVCCYSCGAPMGNIVAGITHEDDCEYVRLTQESGGE